MIRGFLWGWGTLSRIAEDYCPGVTKTEAQCSTAGGRWQHIPCKLEFACAPCINLVPNMIQYKCSAAT